MFSFCNHWQHQIVGNNAKRWISKRRLQARNFSKIEHFLPPDTHTCACASEGQKCPFFGKFGVLCFLVSSVLRFALFSYYRRNNFFEIFWGYKMGTLGRNKLNILPILIFFSKNLLYDYVHINTFLRKRECSCSSNKLIQIKFLQINIK